MFKPKQHVSYASLLKQLQGILRSHGFVHAADNFDVGQVNKKLILDAIKSWTNYPKCMDKYPEILTEKIYDDETTYYVRKLS